MRVAKELFRGHFEVEMDVSAKSDLVDVAVGAGMEREEVREWLDSGRGGKEVDREAEERGRRELTRCRLLRLIGRGLRARRMRRRSMRCSGPSRKRVLEDSKPIPRCCLIVQAIHGGIKAYLYRISVGVIGKARQRRGRSIAMPSTAWVPVSSQSTPRQP